MSMASVRIGKELPPAANPDDPCCNPLTARPPMAAALAIYARSSDGFSEWFPGTFDGMCWWSTQVPADGARWTVVGWRALDDDEAPVRMDCRAADDPVTGPRLFRVDPATARRPGRASGG